MHDLVIRNATIVDGTGRDRFTGDLAVDAGRIVCVGEVPGEGAREIDIGTQMPHSAIRAYVMGKEGSYRGVATDDEIREMADITREGLCAGALGFSTSRTILHRDKNGVVIPGTNSTTEEMLALGRTLGDVGHGVFEMVSDHQGKEPDLAWMTQYAEETGSPITFVVAQVDHDPDGWRVILDQAADLADRGIVLRPQTPGRPTGMLMGFITSLHPFITHPSFKKIADLPHQEMLAELRKPETRARILSEKPDVQGGILSALLNNFGKFFPIHESHSRRWSRSRPTIRRRSTDSKIADRSHLA